MNIYTMSHARDQQGFRVITRPIRILKLVNGRWINCFFLENTRTLDQIKATFPGVYYKIDRFDHWVYQLDGDRDVKEKDFDVPI